MKGYPWLPTKRIFLRQKRKAIRTMLKISRNELRIGCAINDVFPESHFLYDCDFVKDFLRHMLEHCQEPKRKGPEK